MNVVRCVKSATHSYGESVVPLGDSALVEVPYPDGGSIFFAFHSELVRSSSLPSFIWITAKKAARLDFVTGNAPHSHFPCCRPCRLICCQVVGCW